MGSIDLFLEVTLVALLAITLVHAIRLERALRTLRQDRAALGDAIAGIDDSARQAEAGMSRLHSATAQSTEALSQRLDQAVSLKDDLQFLIDRGATVADRLDALVRVARATPDAPAAPAASPASTPEPKVRSQAERELLLALRGAQ